MTETNNFINMEGWISKMFGCAVMMEGASKQGQIFLSSIMYRVALELAQTAV